MSKLIVCRDTLLLKDKGQLYDNMDTIIEYISQGNRLLLSSSNPFSFSFFNTNHIIKVSKRKFVSLPKSTYFTDLSCLNGMFLYTNYGELVNKMQINPKAVEIFKKIYNNKNDKITYETPFNDEESEIVGGIVINTTPLHWGQTMKDINKVMEQMIKIDHNLILKSLKKDASQLRPTTFEIRSIKANEGNQINEIVNNSDVNPKEVHYLGEIQPNSLIKCLKMIMR